jgi:hypothetical protein
MKSYKIYSLDKAGRIARAQDVPCRDDLDALDWARKAAALDGMEVWDGSRLVARVSPHSDSVNPRSGRSS